MALDAHSTRCRQAADESNPRSGLHTSKPRQLAAIPVIGTIFN